jgi:transcriptional regulator with XRE-family HTH domain
VISSRLSKRFGAVIKRHRLASGITQEALAESAKLHTTYVSMVERGVRNPTLQVAFQLAAALKIALPDLITEALEKSSGKEKRHE